MADQAGRVAYAHGSAFTTEALEAYAAELGPHLPAGRAGDLPGERRLRGDRDGPQARPGLPPRARARPNAGSSIARWGSYHGNTLGALDLSGPQAAPPPVRGLARPVPARRARPIRTGRASPARTPSATPTSSPPSSSGRSRRPGRAPSPRSSPSRSSGATLAAAVAARRLLAGDRRGLPPPRRPAHRRRGDDRLRADRPLVRESTTGASGRTSSSRPRAPRPGYWPFGFAAASDEVYRTVMGGGPFVHGFTYSHSPTGAAVAREVLRILEAEDLVTASAAKGERLRDLLTARLGRSSGRRRDPRAGPDGRLELVADRDHPGAVPARGPAHRGRRRAAPATGASSSTPGPATPTASTATSSCSGRPSSSPTTSSCGSADGVAGAIAEAVAALPVASGTPG